jgi:hypothetical protein
MIALFVTLKDHRDDPGPEKMTDQIAGQIGQIWKTGEHAAEGAPQ